jgi:hypothetical protein
MRSLALFAFILFVGLASARGEENQLRDFAQLMRALNNGAEVRAVIRYAQCKLIADSVEIKAPDAVGGLSLSTFEYFAKMSVRNPRSFVSSSQTVLISHPRYGTVLNYVRLKIFEDGNVEITARYLSPTSYQIVMDETFYGGISSGGDEKAVSLYAH